MNIITDMWPQFQESSTQSNALCMAKSLTMCRLCLLNTGTSSMEPIFRITNSNCIADKIANITRISLFEGDGLPALVCQQCIFQLDVADAFIQRCMLSDRSLRVMLSQGQAMAATHNFAQDTNQRSITDHDTQPQPSKEIFSEHHIKYPEAFVQDAGTLPGNDLTLNLEDSDDTPNFERIDLPILPEHVILDDGYVEEDAELSSEVRTFLPAAGNLELQLVPLDPLLGLKYETALESVLNEENTINGMSPVKMEVPDYSPNFEYTSAGFVNQVLDSEDNFSVKTEDSTNLLNENNDDYDEEVDEHADNIISGTEDRQEDQTPQLSQQKRYSLTYKTQTCPICSVKFASKWTLARHSKLHKKKENLENRRKAFAALKNSSRLHHSSESNVEQMANFQGSEITHNSEVEGSADDTMAASAKIAQEITSTRLSEGHRSLATAGKHICPICFSKFSSNSNLRRHIPLHGKKTPKMGLENQSTNLKQFEISLQMNQLKMIPVVKVTQLVITKAFLQDNSVTLSEEQQSQLIAPKQSLTGHKHLLESNQIQKDWKSASSQAQKPTVNRNNCFAGPPKQKVDLSTASITDGQLKPAAEIEMQWDYHKLSLAKKTDARKGVGCHICKRVCHNASTLERHRRSHQGERLFKRVHCNKSYHNRYNLGEHLEKHTAEIKYKCKECALSFQLITQLQSHMLCHVMPHKCPTCSKVFKLKQHLKVHSLVHSDERKWACEKCNSKFKRHADLRKHIQRHEPNNTIFSGLKSSNKLRAHFMNKLHGHQNKSSTLQEITKTTAGTAANSQELHEHHIIHTTGLSSYKCLSCGKVFKQYQNWEKHTLVTPELDLGSVENAIFHSNGGIT